ncbi:hypothetical protein K1719_043969 [Acacia pycnantha]|nr:hypothetical protein K1719_043969 [Acacia pycnantha]
MTTKSGNWEECRRQKRFVTGGASLDLEAKNAYAKLSADGDTQLLDIRAPSEFRQKLALKFKEPKIPHCSSWTKLVKVNGFKVAYAIKDGAEGP